MPGRRKPFHAEHDRQRGESTWRAQEIGEDVERCAPLDAPGRFAWQRVGAGRLEARQRWQAGGKQQRLAIPLDRIAAG